MKRNVLEGLLVGIGLAAAYMAAGWPGVPLFVAGILCALVGRQRVDARLRRPRWLYRWHAHRLGFFWIPCPVCGRHFSGWEWDKDGWCIYAADGTGNAVCSGRCAKSWRPLFVVKLKLPNR